MTQSGGEKLADPSDIATDQEMRFTESAIRSVQARNKQDQSPDQSPDGDGNYKILDCIVCCNEIGLGRLKIAAKNFLCVFCAAKIERKR